MFLKITDKSFFFITRSNAFSLKITTLYTIKYRKYFESEILLSSKNSTKTLPLSSIQFPGTDITFDEQCKEISPEYVYYPRVSFLFIKDLKITLKFNSCKCFYISKYIDFIFVLLIYGKHKIS